jgi:hypothetical protein
MIISSSKIGLFKGSAENNSIVVEISPFTISTIYG